MKSKSIGGVLGTLERGIMMSSNIAFISEERLDFILERIGPCIVRQIW